MSDIKQMDVAFIGCAGVPNRYGGFEAFMEFCGPHIGEQVKSLYVTCDAALYTDQSPRYKGMERLFVPVRANGAASIIHDLLAFFCIFTKASHIVVLGVSGGLWFPLFRCLCSLTGKRLLVNVDGVEWRRGKFGIGKRIILRGFDWLAQQCAHVVIYDNAGLKEYLLPAAINKAVEICYSGDHVLRLGHILKEAGSALTICRIEPENQLELLIEGALASSLSKYTIVGNWNNSEFGRALRSKYKQETRLKLLDPIYDPEQLCALRETCQFYLHGHSVGGTNPSLVEMLFYDCHIICFDVSYNRFTAGAVGIYFSDVEGLKQSIDAPMQVLAGEIVADRIYLRNKYTRYSIANAYLSAMKV